MRAVNYTTPSGSRLGCQNEHHRLGYRLLRHQCTGDRCAGPALVGRRRAACPGRECAGHAGGSGDRTGRPGRHRAAERAGDGHRLPHHRGQLLRCPAQSRLQGRRVRVLPAGPAARRHPARRQRNRPGERRSGSAANPRTGASGRRRGGRLHPGCLRPALRWRRGPSVPPGGPGLGAAHLRHDGAAQDRAADQRQPRGLRPGTSRRRWRCRRRTPA